NRESHAGRPWQGGGGCPPPPLTSFFQQGGTPPPLVRVNVGGTPHMFWMPEDRALKTGAGLASAHYTNLIFINPLPLCPFGSGSSYRSGGNRNTPKLIIVTFLTGPGQSGLDLQKNFKKCLPFL